MRRAVVAGIVAVVLAAIVAVLALSIKRESFASKVDAGKRPQAPAFDVRTLDGRSRLRLADLRGKVVVVNFFASWCGPCKDEAPILTQLAGAAPRDVVYVGLDYKDPVSSAQAFARTFGLTYALGRDGDGRVGDRFGVTGMPETFVIDAKGRAVAHIGQPIDGPDLQRAVAAAVKGA